MKGLIEKAFNSVKKYTFWDFAILKTSLIALGILIGSYFSVFFLNYTLLLFIIFAISYAWLMYITFFKYTK